MTERHQSNRSEFAKAAGDAVEALLQGRSPGNISGKIALNNLARTEEKLSLQEKAEGNLLEALRLKLTADHHREMGS